MVLSILHRFWDTATYWLKLPIFPTLSHSAPSLRMFPLEFCGEVKREETRVQWRPHDRSLSRFDTVPACADRLTDGFTIASTALCIASYADALYKGYFESGGPDLRKIRGPGWLRYASGNVWRCAGWCKCIGYNKNQEAQLPQRDSASATHVILFSFSDRALHWTPHLLYKYRQSRIDTIS